VLRSVRTGLSLPLAVAMLLLGMAVPAGADPDQGRLERLHAEAARLNARIERDRQQVAELVEEHNVNRVQLRRTRAAEARTQARLEREETRLERARARLGDRVRAIYVTRDGPLTGIEHFLGGRTPHEALTSLTYRERVIERDQALVAGVTKARDELASSAADLRHRRREQERVAERVEGQRRAISERLAAQRAELERVDADVRAAMERQRQAAQRRRDATAATWVASGGGDGSASGTAGRAVQWALGQLGKPYRWGATGLSTFDCSGLTMRSYQAAGVAIPRTSRSQWSVGPRVDRNNLRPGDLLFFGGSPATISHVGMYVGSGKMVEAPHTGATVRVASIFRGNYLGARRPAA
jgi:cell wall-associated NlpC family hydrolase